MIDDDAYNKDPTELVGTVVKAERKDTAIRLTYADGRSFTLDGDGYDGLWKYVSVIQDESERDLGVDSAHNDG